MPEIIHNDGTMQTVRLSEKTEPFGEMRTLFTHITSDHAKLMRMHSDPCIGSESFLLTSQEADDFVAAWAAYQTQLREAEETKKNQQEADIAMAFTMAKRYPEITIQEDEYTNRETEPPTHGPTWHVSVPSLDWNTNNRIASSWTYTAEAFLAEVQQAIEVIRKHQIAQAKEKNCIAKAYKLTQEHPEIAIEVSPPGEHWWHVSIPTQGWTTSLPAVNPQELYDHVQTALTVLQPHTRQHIAEVTE